MLEEAAMMLSTMIYCLRNLEEQSFIILQVGRLKTSFRMEDELKLEKRKQLRYKERETQTIQYSEKI